MAEKIGTRILFPALDRRVAEVTGEPITSSHWEVAEQTIYEFCRGCDYQQQPSNVCSMAGRNNQGKAVLRVWCNRAAMDGERGQMTTDGFYAKPPRVEEVRSANSVIIDFLNYKPGLKII